MACTQAQKVLQEPDESGDRCVQHPADLDGSPVLLVLVTLASQALLMRMRSLSITLRLVSGLLGSMLRLLSPV